MAASGLNPGQGKGQPLFSPSQTDTPLRRRCQILVVEDNKPDVFLIREAIRTAGVNADVHVVYDGEQATEFFNSSDDTNTCPDLILLDMKMPVMNGWEFCRALECRDARPPIVVLTAAPDPAARAAEAHADGWLGKPFDYAELEATVRRFAGRPTR